MTHTRLGGRSRSVCAVNGRHCTICRRTGIRAASLRHASACGRFYSKSGKKSVRDTKHIQNSYTGGLHAFGKKATRQLLRHGKGIRLITRG